MDALKSPRRHATAKSTWPPPQAASDLLEENLNEINNNLERLNIKINLRIVIIILQPSLSHQQKMKSPIVSMPLTIQIGRAHVWTPVTV